MIEVRGADEVHLARDVKLVHEVQQRDRIRAARQRHHHARVRAEQPVLANELPNAIEQAWTWAGEAGAAGRAGAARGQTRRPVLPILPIPPILAQNLVPEDGLEPSTWRL